MSSGVASRQAAAIIVLGVFASLPLPARAEDAPPVAGLASIADLAARSLPAVVNVSTTQTLKSDAKPEADEPDATPGSPFDQFFKDFMERQGHGGDAPAPADRKVTSLGSGFIIDASGLVVTNNHVIADADEIMVILQDNTTIKAHLVGRDVTTDLALLRIKTDHKLVAVSFGDSDKPRIGDWVMAVGNPFGLGGTVTAGILSARGRAIGDDGPYDDFLQTDAAINKGNSGGPLFDLDGRVIGIDSAIFSPSGGSIGLGFAIPSNLAKPVIAEIEAYGKVRRSSLGVRIEGLTEDTAAALDLDKPAGVLVAATVPDGAAEKAGIEPGDVILSIDGRPTDVPRHLQRIIGETPVDKSVAIRLWRRHAIKLVNVKLGPADDDDDEVSAAPAAGAGQQVNTLGLTFSEATPALKEKYQLSDTASVVITGIAKGGPAGAEDVKPGDVVVEVAQEEVKSVGDLTKKLDAAKRAGRKSVLVLIDRGGDLRFMSLRIG